MGESSESRVRLGTLKKGNEVVSYDHERCVFLLGDSTTTVDTLVEYDAAQEVEWDRLYMRERLDQLKSKGAKEDQPSKTRFNDWLGRIESGFCKTAAGRITWFSLMVLFLLLVLLCGVSAILRGCDYVDARLEVGLEGPAETTETVTTSRATQETTLSTGVSHAADEELPRPWGSAQTTSGAEGQLFWQQESKVTNLAGGKRPERFGTTATIAAIVGSLLSLLAYVISDALKHTSDNKKSVEQDKLDQTKNAEEEKARLRIVMRAVDLLHESDDAEKHSQTSSLQIEGVVLALAQYDIELALDIVGRLPWVHSCGDNRCEECKETPSVTWETAARLVQRAFDSGGEDAQNTAAWLLCKNYDQISVFDDGCEAAKLTGTSRFLATSTRIWPFSGPGWRDGMSSATAGLLIKAASKWLAHELAKAPDTIPQPALVLFEALRKDSRPLITDIAAHSLEPLLYARETTDTSRGAWSLNPFVRQDPLQKEYVKSYEGHFLVTIADMRREVTRVLDDDPCRSRTPLSERSVRLRAAVEAALGKGPTYRLGIGPPIALPAARDGGAFPRDVE